MVGLVAPALGAILLGLLLGGSLTGWSSVRLRWWMLALCAFGVQLALYNPPIDRQPWAIEWGPWVWVATKIVIAAMLLRNLVAGSGIARGPWALALLGALLNLVAVTANGGYMPQSAEARATTLAARGLGELTTKATTPQLRNVIPMGPDTRLNLLGDVIAQPAWLPRANVISGADVILSLGLAWWALGVTTSHPRSRRIRSRLAARQAHRASL